ncbi:MAG: patatin-like phospholipase family protein [bacterium]|nr:patatin-like phospholipase family protein [bacterium]
MLDLNPQNKKLILSIDGGGMRGTITITMLAALERLTGKPAYDLFDLIGGTSTGAIIAAGLCTGYSAQEILELVYRDRLPKAFGSGGIAAALRYLLNGFRHLYELTPFIDSLAPLVAGRTIRDLVKPIIFMTAHDVRTSSTIYIVSKGPGALLTADYPLSGAVAASGAAPIYFPPVAGNLIDGGVGSYSNPCFATAVEAMEYIGAAEGFTPGNVILMSVGTGYAPNLQAEGRAGRFNLIDWVRYIIGEQLDEAGLQQTTITRAVYGDRIDFRRYNPLLTRASVEDALGIDTTGRPDPAALALDSRAPQAIALMEDIGRAYAERIDWLQPGVMPWDTIGGHDAPNTNRLPIDWSNTPFR